MTALRLMPQVYSRDLQRIQQHLVAHDASRVEERLAAIFDALEILRRHPEIGRSDVEGFRELVIGKGARGYVARYRYDRLEDSVDVLAIRAQREGGFVP